MEETNGDLDAAIKSLRKEVIKSCQKIRPIAKEGRIITTIINNVAVILELNCETDFVASNNNFIQLGKTISKAIAEHTVSTVDEVKALEVNGSKVSELISDAVLQLGRTLMLDSSNDGQLVVLLTMSIPTEK